MSTRLRLVGVTKRELSAIIALQDEGIFALDHNGILTYLNPRAERLLGWREDELLGTSALDSLFDVAQGLDLPGLDGAMVPGAPAQLRIGNLSLRGRDGRAIEAVHVTVPVIEQEQLSGMLTAWRPVTKESSVAEVLAFVQRAVADARQAVVIAGADCRVRFINRAAVEQLGYSKEALNDAGGIHALLADPHAAQMFFDTLRNDARWSAQTEIVWGGSEVVPAFVHAGPLKIAGETVALVGLYGQFPEARRPSVAQTEAEALCREVVQGLQSIVLKIDLDGNASFINAYGRTLFGLSDAEAGYSVAGSILPERIVPLLLDGAAQRPEPLLAQNAVETRDGRKLAIAWSVTPLRDAQGTVSGALCVGNQLPQPAAGTALDKIVHEKERALQVLQHVAQGVVTVDARGSIEYFNAMAEQLTGWGGAQAKGMPLTHVLSLVEEETGLPVEDPVRRCLIEGRSVRSRGCCVLKRPDERESLVQYYASPIYEREQKIGGVVLVFNDVTEQLGVERQMAYQASHDALTGLLNRREFEVRVTQALVSARLEFRQFAILMMDLDQFKVVNDTCGHTAGDVLLKQITALFYATLDDIDNAVLARIGGDEFGVLIGDCALEKAQELAERICGAVRDYRFAWFDKSFEIGVSIGAAPISSISGSLAEVLSAVEAACYVAKKKGRNRAHIYQPDDAALLQHRGEMQWVHRIHQALKENLFCLYYQRILPLSSRVSGEQHHEILLRMIEHNGRVITPTAFISAAERYHLMPTVDRWVIAKAFPMIKSLRVNQSELWDIFTVNLSGQSLCDEHFLDFVIEQAQKTGINAKDVCFEITETAAISNLARAAEFITTLKGMGFRFALDDFGSGLSSFGYLKNLPVDYLKIDGSFIRDVVHDSTNQAMVESINHIGHVLGIQTIAEFVENDDTLFKLWEMGIDHVQGYGIARPEPLWLSFQSHAHH